MATNKDMLNKANQNEVASLLQSAALGDVMRGLPTYLHGKAQGATGANPYDHSTLGSIVLPDDAKACTILRATGKVGGVSGQDLTIDAYGTTPASTHCAVSPAGNLVFLGTDAWTNIDVVYLPEKGQMVQLTLAAASDTIVLPAPMAGAILLSECEVITGSVTGKFEVLVPGGTPGTSAKANLSLDKTQVNFKHTDGVTSARLKIFVPSSVDLDAYLEANASF
jgi:hypothetical protein